MSAVETEPMATGRSEAGGGNAYRLRLGGKGGGGGSGGCWLGGGLVWRGGGAGAAGGAGDFAALWGQGRTGPGATGTEANTTPEPATVRQPTATRVHALGRLEPAGQVVNLAQPSGNDGARVEALLVAEGDDVVADQVVARLDTYSRKLAAVQEAEARAGAARGKLAQIKAGAKQGDIEAAKEAVALFAEQLVMTTKELERANKLVEKKTISVEEFDTKKWARDRLLIEHRRAVQQLASLSEVRATDVAAQELEIASALAAVDSARETLLSTEVRARTAGRVLKIHTQPGEKTGDQGMMEIGAVTRMQAVAEVFEGDVGRIRVGQKAEIVIDATGETIAGTVESLGNIVGRKVVLTNDPVSDTDARVLEVRINLDPAAIERVTRLSNARVEVTIQVGES